MSENRTGRRFPLELPIKVAGKEAMTKNVSAAGIFASTDVDLQVGTEVDFELTLPASVVGGAADVQVQCKGRVVRVNEPEVAAAAAAGAGSSGEGRGVACVIDRYKIVRK